MIACLFAYLLDCAVIVLLWFAVFGLFCFVLFCFVLVCCGSLWFVCVFVCSFACFRCRSCHRAGVRFRYMVCFGGMCAVAVSNAAALAFAVGMALL